MKIAITGHTDGIGHAIAEACMNAGHDVLGFSRSNGYHLFTDMEAVITEAADCDVFVNNRYGYRRGEEGGQVEMLFRMYEQWVGRDKRIINISSRAGTYPSGKLASRYAIQKHALDAACDQLNANLDMRPRVSNIKPGYVDTPSIKHITNHPKLAPEAVADAVMWMLNQPRMIHISTISMAHMQFG